MLNDEQELSRKGREINFPRGETSLFKYLEMRGINFSSVKTKKFVKQRLLRIRLGTQRSYYSGALKAYQGHRFPYKVNKPFNNLKDDSDMISLALWADNFGCI